MIYLDKIQRLKMNKKIISDQDNFLTEYVQFILNEGIDSFISKIASGDWLKEQEYKEKERVVKAKAKELESKINDVKKYFDDVKKYKDRSLKNAIDTIGDEEEGKIADIINLTDEYIEKNKNIDVKFIRPDKNYSNSIFKILISINNLENKVIPDVSPKQIAEKFDIDLKFISYQTKDSSGKAIIYDAVSHYKQMETRNAFAKYITPYVEKLNNIIKNETIHKIQSSNIGLETFLVKTFKLYDNHYTNDVSKRELLPITNLKKFYDFSKGVSFNITQMFNEMWKQQVITTDTSKSDLSLFIEQILPKDSDIIKRTVEKYVGEVYYRLFNKLQKDLTFKEIDNLFKMIINYHNDMDELETPSTHQDKILLFKNCICLLYVLIVKRPKFFEDSTGTVNVLEKFFNTIKEIDFVEMLDKTLELSKVSGSNKVDFNNKLSYFSPLNLFESTTKQTIVSTSIEKSFDSGSDIYKELKNRKLDCDTVLFGGEKTDAELVFRDSFYINLKQFNTDVKDIEVLYRINFLHKSGSTGNMNSFPHLQSVEKMFSIALNSGVQYTYNNNTIKFSSKKTSDIDTNLSNFILNLTGEISGEGIETNILQKGQTEIFRKCCTQVLFLLSSNLVKRHCTDNNYSIYDFNDIVKLSKDIKLKDSKFFENVSENMDKFENSFSNIFINSVNTTTQAKTFSKISIFKDIIESNVGAVSSFLYRENSFVHLSKVFTEQNFLSVYDDFVDANNTLYENENYTFYELDSIKDFTNIKKLRKYAIDVETNETSKITIDMKESDLKMCLNDLLTLYKNITAYYLNLLISKDIIDDVEINDESETHNFKITLNNILMLFRISFESEKNILNYIDNIEILITKNNEVESFVNTKYTTQDAFKTAFEKTLKSIK